MNYIFFIFLMFCDINAKSNLDISLKYSDYYKCGDINLNLIQSEVEDNQFWISSNKAILIPGSCVTYKVSVNSNFEKEEIIKGNISSLIPHYTQYVSNSAYLFTRLETIDGPKFIRKNLNNSNRIFITKSNIEITNNIFVKDKYKMTTNMYFIYQVKIK